VKITWDKWRDDERKDEHFEKSHEDFSRERHEHNGFVRKLGEATQEPYYHTDHNPANSECEKEVGSDPLPYLQVVTKNTVLLNIVQKLGEIAVLTYKFSTYMALAPKPTAAAFTSESKEIKDK